MQSEAGLQGHDQLFKQLLQAFFADFLRLFDPDTAARLDLDTITFVNPEVFTDFPQGERRTADIVVQVQTLDGDTELILIHVEVQRKHEPDFPWRMWQYYSLLRLTAGDYVDRGPLAAGLASLMRPAKRGSAARVALYIACLRGVQRAVDAGELDEARRFALFNLIFTYLRLSAREREAARVQLRQEGDTAMEAVELTWADRIILQSREEGLKVARRAVLGLLSKQFGTLPPSISAGLDRINDPQQLEALLNVALSARTLEEVAQALQ